MIIELVYCNELILKVLINLEGINSINPKNKGQTEIKKFDLFLSEEDTKDLITKFITYHQFFSFRGATIQ